MGRRDREHETNKGCEDSKCTYAILIKIPGVYMGDEENESKCDHKRVIALESNGMPGSQS